MSLSLLATIPKLNGTNYASWKNHVTAFLHTQDLGSILEAALPLWCYSLVTASATASDADKGLTLLFLSPPLREEEIVDKILVSLDPTFASIRTVLCLRIPASSLVEVRNALVEFETQLGSAAVAKARGYETNTQRKDSVCWRCGRAKHTAQYCVADMPEDIKRKVLSRSRDTQYANIAAPSPPVCDPIMDDPSALFALHTDKGGYTTYHDPPATDLVAVRNHTLVIEGAAVLFIDHVHGNVHPIIPDSVQSLSKADIELVKSIERIGHVILDSLDVPPHQRRVTLQIPCRRMKYPVVQGGKGSVKGFSCCWNDVDVYVLCPVEEKRISYVPRTCWKSHCARQLNVSYLVHCIDDILTNEQEAICRLSLSEGTHVLPIMRECAIFLGLCGVYHAHLAETTQRKTLPRVAVSYLRLKLANRRGAIGQRARLCLSA
ncbi:HIT domain protein [Salix suchowensis]|nr:HIT domain protein [Salix suchowensis]